MRTRNKIRHLVCEPLEPRQLLTTFYVDAPGGDGLAGGGSDSNNGTSLATPFATIQQAANQAQAGDTVIIRGGTYREEVNVPRSGNSTNPIVFNAYNDEEVILSGADLVTGWTQAPAIGANVWQATVNWDAGGNANANTLFVNGDLKYEARLFAENDLLDANDWGQLSNSGLTTTTLTSSDLVGFGDDTLNGATIIFQSFDWVFETRTIADYDSSAGRVTFDQPIDGKSIKQTNIFDVVDSIETLDNAGEWYKQGNTLYYQAEAGQNPNSLEIEFKNRAFGFDLRGSRYIHVDGLTFRGASINTDSSSDFNVYQDNVFYAYDRASYGRFNIHGNNGVIRDNEFYEVWGSALNISSSGTRADVVNNYFHDIGLSPTARAMNTSSTSELFFSHNTVRKFARSVFDGYPSRSEFAYNLFEDGGRTSYDTGAFDSDGGGGNNSASIFHHNVFRNTDSRGILEAFYGLNNNTVIHHNLFHDWQTNDRLFRADGTEFRQVYHNTFIGSAPAGSSRGSADPDTIIQARYNNNLQISMENSEGLGIDTRGNHNYTPNDFVDFNSRDFRLASDSEAVDKGIVLPGINDGYTGAAPDAGALEFGEAMWSFGHDFVNPPNPSYAWTSLPGTNLYANGQFNAGISDWTIESGSPNSADRNSWNLQESSSLTGSFRTHSVEFTPGEAMSQQFTGLKPNTTYTVGVAARAIDEVTVGGQFNSSSGGVSTGTIRDTYFVTGLTDNSNSWVRYDNIDFGDPDQFDQIEILAARNGTNNSIAGTSIEIRLDSPNGLLLGRMEDITEYTDTPLFAPNRTGLTPTSGVHSIYISVQGSNAANVAVGNVRLVKEVLPTSDLLTVSADSAGAETATRQFGWTDWQNGYETLVFTTGPSATQATITFANNGRINTYLDRFYLVEGEVRIGDNLAYVTGDSSQSTTAAGQFALNAVDQDLSTFSETQDASNSWWQVRFGANLSIGEIVLFNRDDARFNELSNFTVSVWDEEPENGGNMLWEKSFFSTGSVDKGGSLTISGGEVGADGVTRLGGAFGRIIRVQLNGLNNAGNGRLSLADVVVRGSDKAKPSTNLALFGQASHSSFHYAPSDDSGLANNGKVDPATEFTTTTNEWQAWWQVELEHPSQIDQIVVVNRLAAANRIGNFSVSVWDGDPNAGGSELWGRNYSYSSNAPPLSTNSIGPGGALRIDGSTTSGGTRLDQVNDGRYVRVQLNGTNFLSLAEVQVWAPDEEVSIDLSEENLHFDLGKSNSPVQNDWTQITPYSYGDAWWDSAVSAQHQPSPSANDINEDFITDTELAALSIPLPNGIWQVTLNMGDENATRDNMSLWINDEMISSDIDSPAGQFSYVDTNGASATPTSFNVEVRDGVLKLQIDDTGDGVGAAPGWVLNRLSLTRIADLPVSVDLNLSNYDYDLGTDSSALASGFDRIKPETSGDIAWSTVVQATSRSAGGDLNRDFVNGSSNTTLEHALAPGIWDVTVNVGDADLARDNISISAEGIVQLADIDTVAGEFAVETFRVEISDGGLSLDIVDNGGSNSEWVLNRLSIAKVSEIPIVPGDFNADQMVDQLDFVQWQNAYGRDGSADSDLDRDSDGSDFLAWQRNYRVGVQSTTTILNATSGNGSFEDQSGATGDTVIPPHRVFSNNGTATIPGWTVQTTRIAGWDGLSADASSHGDAYAFAIGNGTGTYTSTPIASHTTAENDQFNLTFDVGNSGGTHTYEARLIFGSNTRVLGSINDSTNISGGSLASQMFNYTAVAADAGFAPVIEIVMTNGSATSQSFFDNVALSVTTTVLPSLATTQSIVEDAPVVATATPEVPSSQEMVSPPENFQVASLSSITPWISLGEENQIFENEGTFDVVENPQLTRDDLLTLATSQARVESNQHETDMNTENDELGLIDEVFATL